MANHLVDVRVSLRVGVMANSDGGGYPFYVRK